MSFVKSEKKGKNLVFRGKKKVSEVPKKWCFIRDYEKFIKVMKIIIFEV